MIVVTNRIPVAPGQEAAFEARFAGRAAQVERQPGFRGFQLLRPLRSEYYMVMTWWDSEADFQAWTESEAFREAHRRRPPQELFAGPNVFELHQVIQRVEGPPPATPAAGA